MFKGRKEQKIIQLIKEFFKEVEATLPELSRMLDDYINHDKQFKDEAYQVHIHENKADQMRRNVMAKLYEGALLPFYREDYVVLTIIGDQIANLAERVASFLVLTRPEIPDFMEVGLREMMASTFDTFEPFKKMLDCGFEKCPQLQLLFQEIESREQKVDRLQWDLIKAVFKSDLPLARKIYLKEFIDKIAAISDQIEDVGERLEIIYTKRPI